MAYAVDPVEEDHPDEGSIMCSTECPFANGQVVSYPSFKLAPAMQVLKDRCVV